MRRIPRIWRPLLWGMVCVTFYACASTPHPADKATSVKAQEAFRGWAVKLNRFLENMKPLLEESELLRNHPGWVEMMPIIKAEPSIRRFEGEVAANMKTNAAIAEWSEKWGAPGAVMYVQYHQLVAATRSMETERDSLLKEWGQVYALDLLRALETEPKYREPAIHLCQTWDYKHRCILNSFRIDSMGLYAYTDLSKILPRCVEEWLRSQH